MSPWPISSGMESRHIRALGVLILLLCAWLGFGLYHSSLDKPGITDDRYRLKLDPNTASIAELAALPEIGPATAQRIVDFRAGAGRQGNPRPFTRLSDLDKVPGLGLSTLESLEPYLSFAEK